MASGGDVNGGVVPCGVATSAGIGYGWLPVAIHGDGVRVLRQPQVVVLANSCFWWSKAKIWSWCCS
jgi:hypothetical protein